MHTGILIIALGFGFKIYAEASAHAKKSIKQLGKAVGIVMMVVSLGGILCTVWTVATYAKLNCPIHGFQKNTAMGKIFCPFTTNKTESTPQEAPANQ